MVRLVFCFYRGSWKFGIFIRRLFGLVEYVKFS